MADYILTGATGFIGRKIVDRLIEGGNKVILIGKSKGDESFASRIEKIFGEKISSIKTVEFDLDTETSENLIERIKKNIDLTSQTLGIWHIAANLSFKESDRKKVFGTNIGGTEKIINLALHLNVPLYYFSTAYVHGRANGLVKEVSQSTRPVFNNPYEESKYIAEQKVISSKDLKYIVFRPSIVYDETAEEITNFGYYSFLIGLYKFKKSLNKRIADRVFLPLPFFCVKKSTLNLIPLSHCLEWIFLIANEIESLGKIFHICNPKPNSQKTIFLETFKAGNVYMPIFETYKFITNTYLNLFILSGKIIKPLEPVAKRFFYFKQYLLNQAFYDFSNSTSRLGGDYIGKIGIHSEKHIYHLAHKVLLRLENKK